MEERGGGNPMPLQDSLLPIGNWVNQIALKLPVPKSHVWSAVPEGCRVRHQKNLWVPPKAFEAPGGNVLDLVHANSHEDPN